MLEIDFDTGTIVNVTKGKSYTATAFPSFLQSIMKAGGLMAMAKEMAAAGEK
jgi:3-isopropylmalate/(R)-2-methylmalate dehydratase small subunit